jgi:hypothetical protein
MSFENAGGKKKKKKRFYLVFDFPVFHIACEMMCVLCFGWIRVALMERRGEGCSYETDL